MAGFHTQVSLAGFPFEDFQFTVNLATGITAADIGKALAQDTSAPNTLKLAGDGDAIQAVLLTVEDRAIEGHLIGTATFKFAKKLPVKSGLTGGSAVVKGSRLCGAGSGEVKAIDYGTPSHALTLLMAEAPRAWTAVDSLTVVATKF